MKMATLTGAVRGLGNVRECSPDSLLWEISEVRDCGCDECGL